MRQPTKAISKLKVLVSGHMPPPMGGIATYYQTLMGSSLPRKVDLRFVQTSSQTRDFSTGGSASMANARSALSDVLRFIRALLSHRPRIAHIATAFGLSFAKHSLCVLAARLAGSRVLLHPHCSLAALYDQRPAWWKWYFRQVIRLTDGVIALSNEWNRLTEIVPGSRVYLLVNAVDLEQYEPLARDHTQALERNAPIHVLYLGYLGQAKGTFDLLEAAKKVTAERNNVVFDLVGGELTPGEREQIVQLAADPQMDGRVLVHPPAYDDEKMNFFRQADIFVYPSYFEGMPMAVLEAMACGLPIVASRAGGLPDLVTDGSNGLLVEPGQPSQLAKAITSLVDDPQRRLAMAQTSFQTAHDCYGIEQHVDKLLAVYQAAAG